MRKCRVCYKFGFRLCESIVFATKFVFDFAKVLYLPRNLFLTLRKYYAYCAIQILGTLLCLPHNSTFAKSPCCRANGPVLLGWSEIARARCERSECALNALRLDIANRLVSNSPETPILARGHAFCRFRIPTTRTCLFSCVLIPSFSCVLARATFN